MANDQVSPARKAAIAAVEAIMREAKPEVTGDFQKDCEQWPSQGVTSERMVDLIEAAYSDTPKQSGTLTHTRSCSALNQPLIADDDCTCGLQWRIHLQTEQTMSAAWRKRAQEAAAPPQVSTPSPHLCPTCAASGITCTMSAIYECCNGHEFQGPDVQRIEAGTVGADITMCSADIGRMPVVTLAGAVSTPRCPVCKCEAFQASAGRAQCSNHECKHEAPTAQFFQPEAQPSPPCRFVAGPSPEGAPADDSK